MVNEIPPEGRNEEREKALQRMLKEKAKELEERDVEPT